MEQAFVTLTQGTKSVREYEAEFIRLQKYVNYGYGDDGVMVRKFLQGLTPEIGGRLQAVTYTHLYDLIEKAVNVESFIKREKAMANRGKDNRSQGSGSNPRNVSTTKKTYPTTQGERPRTENMSRGDGACFVCGSKGHFARTFPEKRENGMAVTTQYQPTCYYCGVKGHFSNNCPTKTNIAPRPADRPPAATRSANEAPNKRRTPAKRVYAMGAEIGEHRDQSGGPITGMVFGYLSVPQRTGRLGRGLEMGDGHQEHSMQLGLPLVAHSIELAAPLPPLLHLKVGVASLALVEHG
ncbi:unnamed protein product [Microthlaspi erraticum]|uniref:CCHC-type domain-containing protein n=1 Tax=Microthlaspi erraticum TaxID=1685480 RepID=A0A6D2I7E9_9BRAS|nr:unnamed protein product [Microthlaspi erraticum]